MLLVCRYSGGKSREEQPQPSCQRNASTATPLRPSQLVAGLGRRAAVVLPAGSPLFGGGLSLQIETSPPLPGAGLRPEELIAP